LNCAPLLFVSIPPGAIGIATTIGVSKEKEKFGPEDFGVENFIDLSRSISRCRTL